jgi:hypothetical protein
MEHPHAWRLRAVAGLAVVAVGCASPLPAALSPPPGHVLTHVLRADGVQIYECAAAKERDGVFAWSFKAPEAVLVDAASGRAMGRHYGGPTWEGPDGSVVVGKLKARDDGPDPRAIPWLLLAAEAAGRDGAFSGVRSIQRLQTEGGKPPAEGCDAAAAVARTVRVPYRAVYRFYKAAS